MSAKQLVLLDAYALIYRAYYPHQKRPRLDRLGRDVSAIFGFANTLSELLSSLAPDYVAVVFDPPGGSFRNEEYPDYKAHRPETPEAIRFGVPHIKEIIEAYNIPVVEVLGYEADDVIGTLAWQAEAEGLEVLMVTPDKDYAQLVTPRVSMYRPMNGGGYEEWGEREVCEQFGLSHPRQMIDYLGLVGDSADNLPGVPGVGPKTATTLLQAYGTLDEVLAHASEQKGKLAERLTLGHDLGLMTRHLATICTTVPITLDLERYARREPNVGRIRELFEAFEFRTLLERVMVRCTADIRSLNEASKDINRLDTSKINAVSDGDLFAQNYTEPAEMSLTGEEDLQPEAEAVAWQVVMLDSPERVAEFVALAGKAEALAFDTETTGLDALTAELVGMSFALDQETAYYLPIPEGREEALRALEPFAPLLKGEVLKVGQNIKYDLQILASYGVKLGGELFDTMVAHYLLMPDMNHGLDALSSRYLGYTTMPYEELVAPHKPKDANIREVALERLAYYAAEDAHVTWRLFRYFIPRLEERGQMALMQEVEMPLLRVLASMEREGVRIDTADLERQSRELTQELEQLEAEIQTLAGRPFNVNSPRQLGEVLFDELRISDKVKKTKTGGYTTGEEVLEKLKGKHPIVPMILEYRGLRKLLSTYIDALPELCYPDGKVHSTFNQTVAATGRLSSTNPNIQNIPIRTPRGQAIRGAFVAESDEYVFLSADYSQIELRLMAHFSRDEALIEAFRLGQDVHQATAARIHRLSLEAVTPEMRRQAKTANFGIIYGISAFGLAERLGISRTSAKRLIEGYFASYPGVDRYMKDVVREAQIKGYVSTLMGRRRYLPDINSANSVVRGYAERNAINAPLQGTAADIIKVAMIRIQHELEARGLRSRMILQVHDELNFSVYRPELEEVMELVRRIMSEACPELSVPLEVGMGYGRTWLEAH